MCKNNTTNHVMYTYCDCLMDPKIDECRFKKTIKLAIFTIDTVLVFMVIGLALYL